MSKAIVIESFGAPSGMKFKEVIVSNPKPSEVQIKHSAIEVNYVDVYHREGLYQLPNDSKIPGVSAIGYITKVGSDVDGFREGDRVAYITPNGGAYSQTRNINANFIFSVPESVPDKIAAASIVRGLTAHALCNRVFIVRSGVAVLIHAAAGGVGKILSQWCNHLGAYVIGTVGSDEKKQVALENGCHQVINYNSEDLVAKVVEYTKGIKVNAVYDSIGQTTFDRSLECLMNMGIMVLYGASSGAVDTIDAKKIAAKSLFFTRPSVFHYKGNRFELILSANELFNNIMTGVIKVPEPEFIPLENAALAHEKLQSRGLTNSIVLIP